MKQRAWGLIVGALLIGVAITTWNILHARATRPLGVSLPIAFAADTANKAPALAAQPMLDATPPTPLAEAAVVIDAGSGAVLIAKNPHEALPIASTTKIMSAILLMKSGKNLDQLVTVDQAAASQTGSVMGLETGQTLTLRELLTGALLVSGNDAIYEIAENVGGVPSFVQEMNSTAAQLGLADTHYVDPAGLNDAGHSSAFDLGMLFRYALTFPAVQAIVSMPTTTVETKQGATFQLTNSNRLIQSGQPLYLASDIGGKTGLTPAAGHTLVTAAKQNNHVLIAVILHTDDDSNDASAREADRLLTWTFAHTTWSE